MRTLIAAGLLLFAMPAWAQEEAPDVETGEETPAPTASPAPTPTDVRDRESVFDKPVEQDPPPTTETETPPEPEPEPIPDPTEPYRPPTPPDPQPEIRRPPPMKDKETSHEYKAVPFTLGFKLGVIGDSRDAVESYSFWAGYRHRPIRTDFGPFISAGLELTFQRAPFGGDYIGTIAPTIRAGLDWVPKGMWGPMFGLYGIAGYIEGPTWAFDYGYRVGAGVSLFPLIFAELPSTLEITQDMFVRSGGERVQLLHIQIGVLF